MKHLRWWIWPQNFAARLIISLVAALALAQVALIVILNSQQDGIAERVVHGQTLNVTATLAKLLAASPVNEQDRIIEAFRARQFCAGIETAPAVSREMNATEKNLADRLLRQLQGLHSDAPRIAIEQDMAPCLDLAKGSENAGQPPDPKLQAGDDFPYPSRIVTVITQVPLPDGRWLVVYNGIALPTFWSPVAFLSLFLSSLAAIVAVAIAVRSQTKSLRMLASASERFGRGETFSPLKVSGPSEVAATIQAFNTMYQRLSQFMRDRLRLFASISHDLRTPLTTLRLKAEFIDNDEVREDIVATIDELTTICEATLAFTRAEVSTEDTTLVDLADLIRQVAEEFRLTKGNVHLAALPSLPYPCRPVALKRALRNLVENAIRYGGTASVTLNDADGEVIISVEDDGPGIPDEEIEDAFEAFVRLEPSRSTETGGLGLGLSIARSIVKAHGGTLFLLNREDHGLRAELRLPSK
ncbi:ATP-binding protein [Rhizobium rhizogenes]|uniref:ATP-binding protein n=1 Tax=Rhizobium rhizogenes TaxID=359 RepID=UPI000B072753|nr:ATP-binding protein [Rhizobium rhizogenes]